MSFDRALPEIFAKVDERWHSPTNAIITTAIVAIFGCFAESTIFADVPILGPLIGNGITATDLWDGIFFTTACLSAALLPGRLRDVYDRAPWKPKILGMEGVVVIGWFSFFTNIYLDLIILGEFSILDPLLINGQPIPFAPPIIPNISGLIPDFADFAGTFNWGWWTVFFLTLLGAIIYWYMKSYYSKKGVDFTTIYATIPPE